MIYADGAEGAGGNIFFVKRQITRTAQRMKGGLNKIQCKGRLRQILAIVTFVSKRCFQQDFVDLLKLFSRYTNILI